MSCFAVHIIWCATPLIENQFHYAATRSLGDKETKEELRKMLDRNLKKSMIAMFIVVSILLTIFAVSASLVSASGGSIAMANAYPEDGGTYLVVDHFMYQTTAVNTNTTVSVSIDDGPLIPVTFQSIRNEMVNGDTVARDWYTWQVTIPAITNPGRHTFQFFSHYYVWQNTDHYWAEFDALSTAQSFTIAGPLSTPSQSPPPTTNPVYVIAALTTLPLVALLLLTSIVLRKRGRLLS